jgi:hypothetical protein
MDRFDEDDFDPEGPAFECAGFNDGTGFYCPLWGSEECDWECPNGGLNLTVSLSATFRGMRFKTGLN